MTQPVVALTTDFGPGSVYVGQLHTALLRRSSSIRVIDLAHDIPAGSVRQGELSLRRTILDLPAGAVHVLVVDPGVGSARRPIAVRAAGRLFVGPDNGLLGQALALSGSECVAIERAELFAPAVAPTFHGRDIFCPVAAELALGLDVLELGPRITDAAPSELPRCEVVAGAVRGQTLGADRFGNITTNIPAQLVRELGALEVAGRQASRVRTYMEGAPDTLLWLIGSDGFVELALRDGSASAAWPEVVDAAVELSR